MRNKDDEKKEPVAARKARVVSPEFIAAKERDLEIEVAKRLAGLTSQGGSI